MKQTLSKILRVVTTVLMVASICIMLFTVVSVLTFNRTGSFSDTARSSCCPTPCPPRTSPPATWC